MKSKNSACDDAQFVATVAGPTIPENKSKVQDAGSDAAVPAAPVTAPSAKAKKAAKKAAKSATTKHAAHAGAEPATVAPNEPAPAGQDVGSNGAAASAKVSILSGTIRPEVLPGTKHPAVAVLKTMGQPLVLQVKRIDQLKPHPVSVEVYGGKGSVADLVKDIREIGLHHKPVVTKSNVIICGHRRIRALKELGVTEVEVGVFESEDDIDIKALLLGDNISRNKTNTQIVAEAKLRTEIEQHRVAERKKSGVAKNEVENLPPAKRGKVRDIVGKELDMSGRTVDKALKIAAAIETAKADGREVDAAEVEAKTNKSISAGFKAAVEKGLITATKPKTVKKEKAATKSKKEAAPPPTDEDPPPVPPAPPAPSENPTVTGLDSDTALERADEVLTFLRGLKEAGEELTKPQRKNWERLFDDLDECRADLSL